MEFTLAFIRLLFWGIYLFAPLMLVLCLLIIVLGQVVGRIEGWHRWDAIYWSFITALTVGYGDIRPLRRGTKILAIFVALVGIMFSGIFVALTVHSATKALERHVDMQVILKTEKDKIE